LVDMHSMEYPYGSAPAVLPARKLRVVCRCGTNDVWLGDSGQVRINLVRINTGCLRKR
jgi:hypothetical protein